MQEMAALRNLPIASLKNEAQEGWVGKPKGIKQVLWERGSLDPNVIYNSKVKKMIQIMKAKLPIVMCLLIAPIFSMKRPA
jgi:hypothetical protein